MAFVIKINPPISHESMLTNLGKGSWYLESAVQDSIVLTQDTKQARQFTNRIDANREVMIREQWDCPWPTLKTGFEIVEIN